MDKQLILQPFLAAEINFKTQEQEHCYLSCHG